jgi:ABC-type transporter Mla subunit MlaD
VYQSILENLEGELWELVDEMNDIPESIGHEKKYLHLADRTVEVPLNATADEIRAALQDTGKPKMAVTGAKFLADLIRTRQAQVKEQLAQAGNELNAVMDDMEATANEATNQVKEAKAEVADLKAALGLNSNGAPE